MNDSIFDPIAFEMPKNQYNAIKVIGVGGGGSNAVNYMFQQDIIGVDFVICNTDAQALENSPIPVKIQLGADLTEGMGAGANPEIGAKAAQESYNELREVLSTNTKMVFITAGMGGGTGTGAAPIIAKIAKELSLLTVGIVTMPFEFEGKSRITQAQKGIEKLRENVDSLIVINNNKLREVYGNLGYKSGFSKADEVLSTAAKGIAEVITHHYKQNIDLNDAKTVLSNSGTAIMGSASAEGTDRARNAITKALDSPLLNDNKITGAKNVLLLIVSGTHEVTFDEIGEINDHVRAEAGNDVNIIMGIGDDEQIGEAIAVTIVATGFSSGQQHHITNTEVKKIVHSLEDNQELLFDFSEGKTLPKNELPYIIEDDRDDIVEDSIVIHNLEEEEVIPEKVIYDFDYIPTTDAIKNIEVIFESIQADMEEDDFLISFVEEQIPVKREPLKQMELSFDFPVEKEEPIIQTTAEIKEIQVQDALLYHKAAEQEITYNLSDYEEAPAKQVVAVTKTPKVEDMELQFELKTQVMVQEPEAKTEFDLGDDHDSLTPLNTSISEFRKTTEMRKNSMKQYNYSFHKGNQNIDEYENIPAYKRMNVELEDNPSSSEPARSRTSVDFDENGIKLRTNNSFLHDNVD
jgi:cell division protein FtsZ